MLRHSFAALLVLALAGTAGVALAREDDDRGEREVRVRLQDCPQAVQDTIKKEAGNGKILEIEKETSRDGKVVYEAEIKIDGKIWEIEVAPDGKLLSKELEEEDDD